jgi:hypothetical protein
MVGCVRIASFNTVDWFSDFTLQNIWNSHTQKGGYTLVMIYSLFCVASVRFTACTAWSIPPMKMTSVAALGGFARALV